MNKVISLSLKLVVFLFVEIITIHSVLSQGDTTHILPPVLNLLDVSPNTGFVTLRWNISPDFRADGYIIFRKYNTTDTSSIFVQIDTTYNRYTKSYIDTRAHADYFPVSYKIQAVDTNTTIEWDHSESTSDQITNYLTTDFDACTGRMYLAWTGYKGWGDQLAFYAIYGKEGDNDYKLLDSVSSGALADTFAQIIPNEDYCFVVRAWHANGWVSYSNRKCITAAMLAPPAFISVNTVTVAENKEVSLSFSLDTASQIRDYILLRGHTPSDYPDTLMRWDNYREPALSYTDDLNDSLSSPLYYKLAVVSPCGRLMTTSRPATVIFPGVVYDNFNIHLFWNTCLSYDTLEKYTVYRQTGNDAEVVIAEPSASDTTLTDNIESRQYSPGNTGVYCYRIEATGRNHSSGSQQSSLSSRNCVTADLIVTIPNAFTPNGDGKRDGKNDYFRPVFSFSPDQYHLIIRDRWGTIVFESFDYQQKWNGKDKKNRLVTQGVYSYFLYAQTPRGDILKKSGAVTVIYPR